MRLLDGSAAIRRETKKRSWHSWFAWRPVRVTETGDLVWLEEVKRRQASSVEARTGKVSVFWLYERMRLR